MDFYEASKKTFDQAALPSDVSTNYFRRNPFLHKLLDHIPKGVVDQFKELLNATLINVLDVSRGLFWGGKIIPLLETLKNQFLGRLQYPHSYFIDNGIHSITYVPHKPDY